MARTYVVTGAASGMGKATSALLHQRGHRVIGVDRHQTDVNIDLATTEGRRAMIEGVTDLSGGVVDAVIACAGVSLRPGSPLTAQINYFGAVASVEGLRPLLLRGEQPRAVVVSSLATIFPSHPPLVDACLAGDESLAIRYSEEQIAKGKGRSIYASSKKALVRWVRRECVKPEWAGAGIPLNAVSPAITNTPLAGLDDPEFGKIVERFIPMPLHGQAEPGEIAYLLAWLASTENILVTGQNIFIDGGAEILYRGDDIFQDYDPEEKFGLPEGAH